MISKSIIINKTYNKSPSFGTLALRLRLSHDLYENISKKIAYELTKRVKVFLETSSCHKSNHKTLEKSYREK